MPIPGQYCKASATVVSGTSCPQGKFNDGTAPSNACLPCPAGRYGSGSGLTTSLCSVVCTPVLGKYCAAGIVWFPTPDEPSDIVGDSSGVSCPNGRYGSAAGVCAACPVGKYGSGNGLLSPSCSGPCLAAAGYFCGEGMTQAAGAVCMQGSYSLANSTVCTPCSAGRFGYDSGSTTANCSGGCPPGCVSGSGAASCTECPQGWYSNSAGTVCLFGCVSAPGSYCGLVNHRKTVSSGQIQ